MSNNNKSTNIMKKIVLITALMAITLLGHSQQLLTVSGKTDEGKRIKVEYYKGTSQDRIKSVKYELVDELKADNKNKQNTINDLNYQLNKANRRIDVLNAQLENAGNDDQLSDLNNQMNVKQDEISSLNRQLGEKDAQLESLRAENERLKAQLDSVIAVNRQISQNRSAKTPVIGVEGSVGGVVMMGRLNNTWEKAFTLNKQVAVYYGTGRLMENFPLSVEAGLGYRNLPMSAKIHKYTYSGTLQDVDGDNYQPIFAFDNCSERLSVNYLEIPIRVCFGQPIAHKVSVFGKVGVTPAFIINSHLSNGPYTIKGRYPEWGVTLENIEELGFFTNGGEGDRKVTPERRFNLWANAAVGAYVPLSSSLLFNIGAKLDYPILSAKRFIIDDDKLYLPTGLTEYNGGMLIPSLQAGLVYKMD